MKKILVFIISYLFFGSFLNSQVISIDDCVQLALSNNKIISVKEMEANKVILEAKTMTEIPKTEINYMKGQYNSIQKNDNQWKVSQTFPFPSTYYQQNKLSQNKSKEAINQKEIYKEDLILDLKLTYQDLILAKSKIELLKNQDSLYQILDEKMKVKLKLSDISSVDYSIFINQKLKNNEKLKASLDEFYQIQLKLKKIIGKDILVEPKIDNNELIFESNSTVKDNRRIEYYQIKANEKEIFKKYNLNKALPDLSISYFNQSLIGIQSINGNDVYFGSSKRFQGIDVGISLPLFYMNTSKKNKVLDIEKDQLELEKNYIENQLNQDYFILTSKLKSLNERILLYQSDILVKNKLIKDKTFISFQNGEISQIEWLYSIQLYLESEWDYISILNEKNKTIINLQWITGKTF